MKEMNDFGFQCYIKQAKSYLANPDFSAQLKISVYYGFNINNINYANICKYKHTKT